MRQRQKHARDRQAVDSVRNNFGSRACQIYITPKLIKHRIVEPMVVADAVEIEQTRGCSNADDVSEMLISQDNIKRNRHAGDEEDAWQKNQSIDLQVSRQIDWCVTSEKLNSDCG